MNIMVTVKFIVDHLYITENQANTANKYMKIYIEVPNYNYMTVKDSQYLAYGISYIN